MKRNTKILIKTMSMVLAFMMLLGAGIMSLSFSHSGVKPNDDNFLTPDLAVKAPTSQELLQKKFNAYNTVTEENGKSVVTIFSEEQIADFNDRRDNGEWFWLSSEEMLFLINNTVELFKTYDIVYIRDLDGNLNKYYGLSFFSSEEYYASFNGFDLGVMDASFDLKKDIYETIFKRVEVFNSATFIISKESYLASVYTDINFKLSHDETESLKNAENPWWNNPDSSVRQRNINYSFWNFANDDIYLTSNILNNDYYVTTVLGNSVYTSNFDIENIGIYKYDMHGKTVIVELYEEATQALIARIRLNEATNKQELLDLERLYINTINANIDSSTTDQKKKYRAVIYFNGFSHFGEPIPPILYCPDGNLDIYSFTDEKAIFQEKYDLAGSTELAKYINNLLKNYLTQ